MASVTLVITVDLVSNQSLDFEDFFPKVVKAVPYIVPIRASHFSVAESMGCQVPDSISKV